MADFADYFIRSLTIADEPFLWEMLYEAIFIPEGSPPLPRDIVNIPEIARYVAHWGQADDCGVLAVANRTQLPLGAVWLRLFSEGNKGYGYVDDETPELSIALLPDYRGIGIGTELLCSLFAMARKKYSAISLSVSAQNPALRLYQRLGFQIIRQEGTALIMKKSLLARHGQ